MTGIISQKGRYPCFGKFVTGPYGFYWPRNPSSFANSERASNEKFWSCAGKKGYIIHGMQIRISTMLHGNVSSVIFEIFMLLVLKLSYTSYHLLYKGLNVISQHIKSSAPIEERTLHLIWTIPFHQRTICAYVVNVFCISFLTLNVYTLLPSSPM